MRVRELTLTDFRNFRGKNTISFVDELSGEVRPITVLAGTNGAGKTTILSILWALTSMTYATLIGAYKPSQMTRDELAYNATIQVPELVNSKSKYRWSKILPMAPSSLIEEGHYEELLSKSASIVTEPFFGGSIFFPSERRLNVTEKGGVIEPSTMENRWVYSFENRTEWQGNLEQFLVWQNYLDLEEGNVSRQNFQPFVKTIESILGDGRRATISKGRVRVTTSWGTNGARESVPIAQLPSGDKQILLLFGELARQLRPGVLIMIDEPEISLHPTYQRLVIHQLRKIAKEWDAQIILATHSLEILQAFHESEIIFLNQLEAEPVA